jgi:hypothetical protein
VLLAVDAPKSNRRAMKRRCRRPNAKCCSCSPKDGASAGELAAQLQLELGAVYARCSRMRARGLIQSTGRGFWTVADGSPASQNDAGRAIGAGVAA